MTIVGLLPKSVEEISAFGCQLQFELLPLTKVSSARINETSSKHGLNWFVYSPRTIDYPSDETDMIDVALETAGSMTYLVLCKCEKYTPLHLTLILNKQLQTTNVIAIYCTQHKHLSSISILVKYLFDLRHILNVVSAFIAHP